MSEYEKQAEDHYNNIACNIPDDIEQTIDEGEICKGNTYKIIEYTDKITLEINESVFVDSQSTMELFEAVQLLQAYEVIRK